jgi:hypothetical protein
MAIPTGADVSSPIGLVNGIGAGQAGRGGKSTRGRSAQKQYEYRMARQQLLQPYKVGHCYPSSPSHDCILTEPCSDLQNEGASTTFTVMETPISE